MATLKGEWLLTEQKSGDTVVSKTASYKINGKEVAKLTNLNPAITVGSDGQLAGVSVTEDTESNTITLSKSALVDTKSVALSSNTYTLEINDDIPAVGFDAITKSEVTNGTVTFTGTITAGYTLAANKKNLNYTAAKTGQKLATVSGLAATATKDDVELDEGDGTITLKAAALKAGNASLGLSNGATYKLAIDSDVATPVTSGEWNYNPGTSAGSGKAEFKGTITKEGYTVSADGKTVNYVKAATNSATLATVSNLAADFTKANVSTEVDESGNYVITLPVSSLAGKDVTINSKNYKLVLGDDVPTSENTDPRDEWVVPANATTATYKQIMPLHYDVVGTKVVYSKEADVKTYATVTNLKKGLTADGDNINSGSTPVVKLSNGVITLSKDALDKKTVALTGYSAYSLAIDNSVATTKVDTANPNGQWAVSKTTATYKANTTEGYSKTNDQTITYTAAKTGTVIATIDGLLNGVKVDALKTDVVVDNTEGAGKFTLPASILTDTDVKVNPSAGYTYTLALADSVVKEPAADKTWEASGTTAQLYEGTKAYYTVSGDTVTYHDKVKGNKVATIQNLKSDLTADVLGEKITFGEYDNKTKKTPLKLSGDVLDEKTVMLTGSTYSLALENPDDLAVKKGQTIWELSGTTATFFEYNTDGYAANTAGTQIVYTPSRKGASLGEVSGLKTGLKLVDGEIDGLKGYVTETVIDEGTEATGDEVTVPAKTIVIDKPVVGNTNIVLDTDYGYELAVGKSLTPSGDTKGWKVTGTNSGNSKNTSTYTFEKGAGYRVENDGTLFINQKKETTSIQIAGLDVTDATKSKLYTGVKVDLDAKTLTLSKEVLGTTNVELKTKGYALALDSDVKAPNFGDMTWDMKIKGKAVLKGAVDTEGYTLSSDGAAVTYTAASGTGETLATVSGLNTAAITDPVANDGSAGIEADGSTITLSQKVLGTSKVTLAKGSAYTFALDEDVQQTAEQKKIEWVVSGTNATYKSYELPYYSFDKDGAVVYNKEKNAVTKATVSGLLKDTTIAATDYNDTTKTLTLKADQVATSNLKLTDKDNGGYKLALDTAVPQEADTVTEWVTSGTTATYKTYETPYFAKKDDKEYTYKKATTGTTHAQISGLKKDAAIDNFDEATKTIYLGAAQLDSSANNKKATLTIKDATATGFKLALETAGDNKVTAPSDAPAWKIQDPTKATLTVNYIQKVPANNFVCDGTTITFYNADKDVILAALTGVNKNVSATDVAKIKVKDNEITLPKEVLQTGDTNSSSKVSLSTKGYTLKLASSVATPTESADEWNFANLAKNGNVSYVTPVSEGYTVATDNKSVSYAKAKENTIFTLSGLNKTSGLLNEDDAGLEINEGVITLSNADLLTTSKVTLKNEKGQTYKLALDDALKPQALTTPVWALAGSKATLNTGTSAGYKLDNDTSISQVKQDAKTVVATLEGLKNVKLNDGRLGTMVKNPTTKKDEFVEGIFLRGDNKIALTPDVFGTTNIKLTSDTYTIAEENFAAPVYGDPTWTYEASKGSATYTQTTLEGWTLDAAKKVLQYTAGKDNDVLATVSGLSKTFTGSIDDAVTVDGKTITVNDQDLLFTSKASVATKVKVNGTDSYELALGEDIDKVAIINTDWVTSGTKATLKTYKTAFYSTDKGAIVYNKAVDVANTVQAEVSGIAKDVEINDCVDGDIITLGKDQLGTSTVTLSNKKVGDVTSTFKLVLGNDATKATPDAMATWVTGTGTTAKLTANVTAGFSETADGLKLNYSNKATTPVVAQISGVANGALHDSLTSTEAGTTINLTASQLGTNKNVTIDGKDTYAFKFASDYSSGKINGAATVDTITAAGDSLNINANKGNDIITVSGKNVSVMAGEGDDQITITGSAASINGGKGNDTIKGNGKENIFFYAQGDGNDVIVNFAPAKDTIKTSGKLVSVAKSGSDAVITIGTGTNIGTITLKGKGSSADSINIVDNSNKPISYEVSSSSDVLLADDNYRMDAASLSDITEPFKASFTPYDFETSLDLVKKTDFTPAIAYTSDKK